METLLRTAGPPVLAVVAALAFDRWTEQRGLLPPGFRRSPGGSVAPVLRRAAAGALLALVLWVGAFAPLGLVGQSLTFDPEAIGPARLFLLHGIFAAALAVWLALGFGADLRRWGVQLGFRTPSVARELALGVVAGVAAWGAVLGVLILLGALIWSLGGEGLLSRDPPPMVPWIASLPIALRLGLSLSAGLVEETFFRGFLQPRVGIAVSSLLFILAHLTYEQPLMLVGIALLSVVFALLVEWRQSVWAAVAAHAVFDLLQLLVMIPWALRLLEEGAGEMVPVAVRMLP